MIEINTNDPITNEAITIWGEAGQLSILQEECAEIITAIARFDRGRVDTSAIADEIGDVIICFQSVIQVLKIEEMVKDSMIFKINRLAERIEEIKEKTKEDLG